MFGCVVGEGVGFCFWSVYVGLSFISVDVLLEKVLDSVSDLYM